MDIRSPCHKVGKLIENFKDSERVCTTSNQFKWIGETSKATISK